MDLKEIRTEFASWLEERVTDPKKDYEDDECANAGRFIHGEEKLWPVFKPAFAMFLQDKRIENKDEVFEAGVKEFFKFPWY